MFTFKYFTLFNPIPSTELNNGSLTLRIHEVNMNEFIIYITCCMFSCKKKWKTYCLVWWIRTTDFTAHETVAIVHSAKTRYTENIFSLSN